MESSSNCVCYNFLNLHQNISFKINLFFRVLGSKEFLKFTIAQLITRLIFAIVFGVLLNCVIDKMNILVIQICGTVFFGACSDVAISIEICFNNTIDTCHEWKASNIEFSAMIEKRIVNVLLKNHCPVTRAVWMYKTSNFLNFLLNFNSISSIWVFSRFYYPNILSILSLAALTDLLLTIVVIFKSCIFSIIWSIFNMKSQGQCVKYIFFFAAVCIIISHVEK